MEYKVSGAAVLKYMAENGLNEDEFCEQFELKKETLDSIIKGKKVKLPTLFVLAHKMDLSLESFLA